MPPTPTVRQHLLETLTPCSLIVVAAAARLLPHPPNIAPIAALALLGGAAFPAPWSFALPALAMLLSDLVLGFDTVPITLAVYGSFLTTVVLGTYLRARPSPRRVLAASLSSSVLFYLVTNAAVWWFSGLYPRTSDGLILSYVFAIPFFRHTVLGDIVYTSVLFGAWQFLPAVAKLRRTTRWPWRAQAKGPGETLTERPARTA